MKWKVEERHGVIHVVSEDGEWVANLGLTHVGRGKSRVLNAPAWRNAHLIVWAMSSVEPDDLTPDPK